MLLTKITLELIVSSDETENEHIKWRCSAVTLRNCVGKTRRTQRIAVDKLSYRISKMIGV
jgi:hypothetical protein